MIHTTIESIMNVLGAIAIITLVLSMCIDENESKSAVIVMRSLNAISNLLFIVYNAYLGAFISYLANAFILGIDMYYIHKAVKALIKDEEKEEKCQIKNKDNRTCIEPQI